MTTGRPQLLETPLGRFDYRHVKVDWFRGYEQVEVALGQDAFVAWPEKALLDLIYAVDGGDRPAYLDELRLQNTDVLDLDRLSALAESSGMPKLRRAAAYVRELARREAHVYTPA
jgi:hypothetical protein